MRLADGITEAAKTLLSTCRRTLNELFMTEILNKEDKELHEMGITKPKEEFKEVKLKLILLINILFILNEANFLEIKTNIDLYLSVCKAANDPATNEVNDEIKKTSFPLLIKELKRLAGRPSHFCVPR